MMELFQVAAKLVLDKSGYDKDVTDADKQGKSLAENLTGYMEKAKKVLTGIMSAVVVQKVASAVWNLAKETSAAGDRIDKTSQALGLSRKAFQEWDYILSQSGASIDSMGMSMKTMNEAISKNSGETAVALSKLGLSAAQLQNLSPEQQFEELVKAFQKMPPSAKKSEYALLLFGRNAQSLMPLLNSASGSVDELRNRAHELGLIMSDEDVDASVAFGDALDDLNRVWTAVKQKFGAQMLPTFTRGMIAAANSLGKVANQVQTAFKTGDWSGVFETITTEIKTLLPKAIDTIVNIGVGLFQNADKIISLGFSVLQGLISGLRENLPTFVAKIPEIFDAFVTGLAELGVTAGNGIIDAINEIFGTKIPHIDIDGVNEVIEDIKALSREWGTVKDWIGKTYTTVVKWIERYFPEVSGGIELMKEEIAKIPEAVVTWTVRNWQAIQSTMSAVSFATHKIFEIFVEFKRKAWDTISKAVIDITVWTLKTWPIVVSFSRKAWDTISKAIIDITVWGNKAWNVTVAFARKSWDVISKAIIDITVWSYKTWPIVVTFSKKAWDTISRAIIDITVWGNRTWNVTVTFAKKAWDTISRAIIDITVWGNKAWNVTVTFAKKAWDTISRAVIDITVWTLKAWNITVTFVRNAWDTISRAIIDVTVWTLKAWNITVNWINDGWLAVKNAFSLLGSWINNKVNEIKVTWTSIIDSWITTINEWIEKGEKATIQFTGEIFGWVKTIADWVKNGIDVGVRFFNSTVETVGDAVNFTSNAVTNPDSTERSLVNGILEFTRHQFGFAKGLNYVPSEGLYRLHRGETILNQSQGRAWRNGESNGFNVDEMYYAVASAVSEAVSNIQINMSGKKVGNAVTRQVSRNQYQDALGRRYAPI